MQFKMKITLIVILLSFAMLAACRANENDPTSTPEIANVTNTPPSDCVEPSVKILSPQIELLAQEEIRIAADADGDDISYEWTAVSGTINNPTQRVIAYIAAENVTNDTITLIINSACGETNATLDLTITPSTATPTPQPSVTPTPTDTTTNTPVPTETSTPTPTYTRVSATPTPESVGIPPINLAEPKDNTCVSGNSATFQWEWDWALNDIEGPGGDYFAINIWSPESQVRSATWIKDRFYIVNKPQDPIVVYTQNVDCTQEKGCFWNVDVIRANVPPGQGDQPNSHTVIGRSPIRSFCVVYSDNGLFTQNPPKDTPVPTSPGPAPTPTLPIINEGG